MKNITKLAVSALLAVAVLSSSSFASAPKGRMIYIKKMKSVCGFTGDKFTRKHTQDEWEEIYKAGKFADEAAKICPGLKLKPSYIDDVYDFAYIFASDSGNVPSC